jgi:hypothetical protein
MLTKEYRKQDASLAFLYRRSPKTGKSGRWQVQLNRYGVCYSASFYDILFNGAENALSAAQAFRDALLERLTPEPSDGVDTVDDGEANIKRLPGSDRVSPYWQTQMKIDGIIQRKSFSIKKYGEETARQMALDAYAALKQERAARGQAPSTAPFDPPSKEDVKQIEKDVRAQFNKQRKGVGSGEWRERKTHGIDLTQPDAAAKLLAYVADKALTTDIHLVVSDPMYGVLRGDGTTGDSPDCWVVDVDGAGSHNRRIFNDAAHGGKKLALKTAKRYRDLVLGKLWPMLLSERLRIFECIDVNKIAGLYLTWQNDEPYRWRADISIRGKARTRTFGVRKFGFWRAFELAVLSREAMLQQKKESMFQLRSMPAA